MKVRKIIISLMIGVVVLTGCAAAWLLASPWGAAFLVHEVTERLVGPGKVSWARFEGSAWRGIVVHDLEVRDPGLLPPGSDVRVQALTIRLKGLTGIADLVVDIENARLLPPGRDNIMLRGHLEDGFINANVYARSLELRDVRDILIRHFDLIPFKGTCENIDLMVNGRIARPQVRGEFLVTRVVQNEFTLENVPVRADLSFVRGLSHWQIYGALYLQQGALRSPLVNITLAPSRLIFTGAFARPGLDVRASSRIARTTIDITVKGTRQDPQVTLSSDPPYPREQILFMLATGKRWSGIETLTGPGGRSRELGANFVDYLLFGGSRGRIIQSLGLSDISLQAAENKQGVSVSKELTDRLDVGYGVEVTTDAQRRQRALTQRIESEFSLTNKLSVSAQKELKGTRTDQGTPLDPLDRPDDRVYMKYKTAF